MAEIRLAAEARAERGSAASRRMRHSGRVPGVLYGHGTGPVALTVDGRELRAALAAGGSNALFDLEVGGEVHLAIAREVQQHPVRHTVAHIDFQLVARDELVHGDVPVQLIGDPIEVNRGGGTVEHVVVSLVVRAKPAELPAAIEVDISGLSIGDAIRFADLHLPRGVNCELDPDTVIAVAAPPRVEAAESTTAGETAEAAAGGESAEG